MRWTIPTLIVILTWAGCGVPSSPRVTTASDAASPSCAAAWSETAAWAVALDAEPTGGLGRFRFPLLRNRTAIESDPLVEVFDLFVGRERLDSEPPVTLDSLDDELVRQASRGAKLHRVPPGSEPEALVGVAPDVPWSRVVEITNHLGRAGYAAYFVFERPRSVEPPRWSFRQLRHNLSKLSYYVDPASWVPPSPYERAVRPSEGDLLAPVLAPCPDLVRRARELSHGDSIGAWPGYEDACRCRIDSRNLRSVLWELHPADGSVGRLVHLAPGAAEGTAIIEAAPDAPWSEVGPRIAALPRGATVHLRIAAR
jgi:hypothetical protein